MPRRGSQNPSTFSNITAARQRNLPSKIARKGSVHCLCEFGDYKSGTWRSNAACLISGKSSARSIVDTDGHFTKLD